MIRTPFLHGVVLVCSLSATCVVGCVDVPSTGPAPPDYIAQVRVVNLDPALATGAFISYANGPFTSTTTPVFGDLALSTVADNTTPYATWLAGGKKILVKGVDADTSVLTFSTDQRGTLFVVPTKDIKTYPRFVYLVERYVFAPPGLVDTTRIKFFNALASKDTVDVWVNYLDASNNLVKSAIAQNLAFGRFTSFVIVPSGAARTYYASAIGDSVAVSDSVSVNGASRVDFTVAVYGDSLKVAHVKQFTNN